MESEGVHQRKMRDSLNVKLSRTSTARPLLYSKANNEMLNRLAVVIQDSRNINDISTKGKLPVEAAYTVMKRVTEAAGEPLVPAGLSTFNKLQSLRTDPALKVLTSQTWKNFFAEKSGTNASPEHSNRPATATTSSAKPPRHHNQPRPHSSSGTDHNHHHRGSKDILSTQRQVSILERVHENLIARIEDLWDDLHFSAQERQFYHKTAFKGPVETYEQCRGLALYLEMLELHKTTTKEVIFAIHKREEALRKCYDTLAAIQRKLARSTSLGTIGNGNSGSNTNSRPSSAHHNHNNSSMRTSSSAPNFFFPDYADDSLNSRGGKMAFWKEELLISLDEVRCASLEVIKSIQQWRRLMWRPYAFHWRGLNYLYKMQEDMNLLETASYQRILQLVQLDNEDIICVIFSPAMHSNNQNNNHRSKGGTKRSSRRLSPQQRRQKQHQQEDDPVESAIAALVESFRNNISLDELHAAARVVVDEHKLQQAIATEKEALQMKGVFIPLLKSRRDVSQTVSSSPETSPVPSASMRQKQSSAARHEEQRHQERSDDVIPGLRFAHDTRDADHLTRQNNHLSNRAHDESRQPPERPVDIHVEPTVEQRQQPREQQEQRRHEEEPQEMQLQPPQQTLAHQEEIDRYHNDFYED